MKITVSGYDKGREALVIEAIKAETGQLDECEARDQSFYCEGTVDLSNGQTLEEFADVLALSVGSVEGAERAIIRLRCEDRDNADEASYRPELLTRRADEVQALATA